METLTRHPYHHHPPHPIQTDYCNSMKVSQEKHLLKRIEISHPLYIDEISPVLRLTPLHSNLNSSIIFLVHSNNIMKFAESTWHKSTTATTHTTHLKIMERGSRQPSREADDWVSLDRWHSQSTEHLPDTSQPNTVIYLIKGTVEWMGMFQVHPANTILTYKGSNTPSPRTPRPAPYSAWAFILDGNQ